MDHHRVELQGFTQSLRLFSGKIASELLRRCMTEDTIELICLVLVQTQMNRAHRVQFRQSCQHRADVGHIPRGRIHQIDEQGLSGAQLLQNRAL